MVALALGFLMCFGQDAIAQKAKGALKVEEKAQQKIKVDRQERLANFQAKRATLQQKKANAQKVELKPNAQKVSKDKLKKGSKFSGEKKAVNITVKPREKKANADQIRARIQQKHSLIKIKNQ